MITIIDYGLGNIKAFTNIYKQLNIPFLLAKNVADLDGATKLLLPGVGAFDYAMKQLEDSGMRQRLDEMVLIEKIPVMGICVGMHMMAHNSDEGVLQGLGWFDATVKKFDPKKIPYTTHLPHMGWNDLKPIVNSPLFNGLEENAKFYFLHSYYFSCNQQNDILAITNYGEDFSCVVNKANIYGVQFHPEKSHHYGIQLLKKFAEL